jgi:ADP-heptose:LPS heptosyltransferase
MIRLFRQLDKLDFDIVVDLHNVFRSNLLTTSFKLKGKEIHVYDKMRQTKNDMITGKRSIAPLPQTAQQYMRAFTFLRPGMDLVDGPWISHPAAGLQGRNVCIAPFSLHREKEWKHGHVLRLVQLLEDRGIDIYCMAFGQREQDILAHWNKQCHHINIIDERYSLLEQASLVRAMDVMVSMDSANMHLATIVGTDVISLWGPTHPYLGFSPLGNEAGILQPDEAGKTERPLSRYGRLRSEQAKAASFEAMSTITPERVMDKILELLRRPTSGSPEGRV